jgi:phage tail-like protein
VGLDSGRPDTPWHRVYIDGCIPEGCALTLYARAYEDPDARAGLPFVPQPAPLWTPLPSELPFHAGLAPSRPGESGLFEVLLQYPAGAARTLRGRYLQLRLVLEGDGRHTPAIHALRVYAPRFGYQEAYLPELLRQRAGRDGPGGEAGPANGADVRERLLAALEGMLTPLEGRIAASEALLHAETVPAGLMPGLAGALGLRLPPHWPEPRRRRMLAEGCLLQHWRGTYPGVRLALDIATDGAVARGQVVLVENFRLRRTMATLLGLDMDDRDHPLTLGTGMSGNSIVGDSLILADGDSRVFLALLAPELEGEDAAAVADFFDRYSHRVSVLLHGPARRERARVEEVLAAELPAHLLWRIVETDHPFVLGLSPLLAVDSFLEATPAPRRAVLDDTYLGREGLLSNAIALSPQDANRPPHPSPAGPPPGPAP